MWIRQYAEISTLRTACKISLLVKYWASIWFKLTRAQGLFSLLGQMNTIVLYVAQPQEKNETQFGNCFHRYMPTWEECEDLGILNSSIFILSQTITSHNSSLMFLLNQFMSFPLFLSAQVIPYLLQRLYILIKLFYVCMYIFPTIVKNNGSAISLSHGISVSFLTTSLKNN